MRKVLVLVLLFFVVAMMMNIGCSGAEAEVGTVEPEIVTGSRIYTDLDEIPAPVYVITAEDIAASGATDLGSLLDSRIPGIFMKKKSGVTQQSEIVIRGITTEILVLVDGIPYYRSSHVADGATVDFRSFPLENIERVEVVKGGGSAIYGSMAAGGVINIITKKPGEAGGKIVAETGPNDWSRYYVSGNTGGGDLNAGIWYERVEEGQKRLFYKTTPDNSYDALEYKGDAYGLDLSGEGWAFRATHGEFRYRYNNEYGLNDEEKKYSRFSFRHEWDNVYLLSGYDTQDYDFPLIDGRYYRDSAFTVEAGGKRMVGETILAWGLFYRSEDTEFSDGYGDPVTSRTRYNIAPFSEVSFTIGNWVANLGLRYEIWKQESNDYDELIPKISVQRQFSNGEIFYISASRVFAMPSFYELYIDSSSSLGNPDLRPERGWSYELGLKSPDVNAWSIGLFLISLDDKIKYDNNWPGTWLNLAEFRTYGIEASRRWKLGANWVLALNGTWQHPEEKTDASSDWLRSYGIPEWEIGGSAQYITGPWTVLLSVNLAANQAGSFSSPWSAYDWDADDYVTVDLAVSWGSGGETVRLNCVNLFDGDYTYRSGDNYYYGPERGFRLSWEHRF